MQDHDEHQDNKENDAPYEQESTGEFYQSWRVFLSVIFFNMGAIGIYTIDKELGMICLILIISSAAIGTTSYSILMAKYKNSAREQYYSLGYLCFFLAYIVPQLFTLSLYAYTIQGGEILAGILAVAVYALFILYSLFRSKKHLRANVAVWYGSVQGYPFVDNKSLQVDALPTSKLLLPVMAAGVVGGFYFLFCLITDSATGYTAISKYYFFGCFTILVLTMYLELFSVSIYKYFVLHPRLERLAGKPILSNRQGFLSANAALCDKLFGVPHLPEVGSIYYLRD